jgi:SAM-dependent methyltransferase
MNGRGFMLETLDDFSRAFVDHASNTQHPVLDIGCAYGVATLAALRGGARVCASDMDARHLAVLEDRISIDQKPRLTTQVGQLPSIEFPRASFAGILASRVLHFLAGNDVEEAMKGVQSWLIPGGRLFLVIDTPYMPPWDSSASTYERLKSQGEKWPGLLPDFSRYIADGADNRDHPEFLNPMDPDILGRICEDVGLTVIRKQFMGLQSRGASTTGNEHAGCEAIKPLG